MDADSAVRGAYGDLAGGGPRNRGGGKFQRQCGSWFESTVIDRYRAFCDDGCRAVGAKFRDTFGLAVGGS